MNQTTLDISTAGTIESPKNVVRTKTVAVPPAKAQKSDVTVEEYFSVSLQKLKIQTSLPRLIIKKVVAKTIIKITTMISLLKSRGNFELLFVACTVSNGIPALLPS
ncbi:MAG: hypothetical protein V7K90_02680 [Nostoc sp.]